MLYIVIRVFKLTLFYPTKCPHFFTKTLYFFNYLTKQSTRGIKGIHWLCLAPTKTAFSLSKHNVCHVWQLCCQPRQKMHIPRVMWVNNRAIIIQSTGYNSVKSNKKRHARTQLHTPLSWYDYSLSWSSSNKHRPVDDFQTTGVHTRN